METSPNSAAGEARCLEGGARAQAELWNLADLAQLLVDDGLGQVAELSLIHLTNIYCATTRSQALNWAHSSEQNTEGLTLREFIS